AYMSISGVRLDTTAKARYLEKCEDLRETIQTKLNALVGFDFNVKSVPQKKKFLYDMLRLPAQYTGRGDARKITTNEAAILTLRNLHPSTELNLLLELIAIRTRISDVNKLTPSHDGRIRCSYNIAGTDTDRLSSSSFLDNSGTNLQNVTDGSSSYGADHILAQSL